MLLPHILSCSGRDCFLFDLTYVARCYGYSYSRMCRTPCQGHVQAHDLAYRIRRRKGVLQEVQGQGHGAAEVRGARPPADNNCSAALFANTLILSGLRAAAAGSHRFMRINKRRPSAEEATKHTQNNRNYMLIIDAIEFSLKC